VSDCSGISWVCTCYTVDLGVWEFRGQAGLALSTKSTTPLLLIISGLRTRAVSKASRANRPI
jgi:hypothetical protein